MEQDENGPFGGGDMGLGRMFSDPGLIKKLESHPKTKDAMLDPGFRRKVEALQKGGQADLQGMMGDPRMLSVLGVAMGIDIVSLPLLGSHKLMPGCDGATRGIERDAAGYGWIVRWRIAVVPVRARVEAGTEGYACR